MKVMIIQLDLMMQLINWNIISNSKYNNDLNIKKI